jgi:DNA repair protein RecO (recombination protein O)
MMKPGSAHLGMSEPRSVRLRRTAQEPAFILHRYDWSESSLILDVFTRHHGRVALVAKGVKKPLSGFRSVLLPFVQLQIDYAGEGEVRALKGAEWSCMHAMPQGPGLLLGYYLNELVLKLLARDDPHPRLFDAFAHTMAALAQEQALVREVALRAFELNLLREIGLLPELHRETQTQQPLREDQSYALDAERGLFTCVPTPEASLKAQVWLTLNTALQNDDFVGVQKVLLPVTAAVKNMLRPLLVYHCGQQPLKTRQLMRQLQSLQVAL